MAASLPGLQSQAGGVAAERRRLCPARNEGGSSVGEIAWLTPPAPGISAQLDRGDRTKKAEFNMPEISSIPNPFPELCVSPFTSVLSASLLPKANPRIKQLLRYSGPCLQYERAIAAPLTALECLWKALREIWVPFTVTLTKVSSLESNSNSQSDASLDALGNSNPIAELIPTGVGYEGSGIGVHMSIFPP